MNSYYLSSKSNYSISVLNNIGIACLFFVLFTGFSIQAAHLEELKGESTQGDKDLIELLFPNHQANKDISSTHLHTFPLIIEFSRPELGLYQLFAFKQKQMSDAQVQRLICGYNACGLHAPKNAVYLLGALKSYDQLLNTPIPHQELRQQLIHDFIQYSHNISHPTKNAFNFLDQCSSVLMRFRQKKYAEALHNRIRLVDKYDKEISEINYITTAGATNEESIHLSQEVISWALIPDITYDDITHLQAPFIAQAAYAQESSRHIIPARLQEIIALFRMLDEYSHAFTIAMNLNDLQDTHSTNHVITFIVYKKQRSVSYLVTDSGYCNTLKHYLIDERGNKKLKHIEYSSKNLLQAKVLEDLIYLLNITPLT